MNASRTLAPLLLGALAVPAFGLPFLPIESPTIAVSPALTYALPLALAVLPLISVAGLIHLLKNRTTPRQSFITAWLWGLGFFGAGVSWVYVSLSQFSGLPAAAAALATLAFCAFLALYPALTGLVWFSLRARQNTTRSALFQALSFAALWTLSEWLRGTLFTGFPWLALAYAQMPPSPLAGFASSVGVYGVGFVSVLIAACFTLCTRQQALLIAALIALCGSLLRAVSWTHPAGDAVSVHLLQGNIAQDVKWRPEFLQQSVRTYSALAQEHTAAPRLRVLPETAIPLLFERIPEDVISALTARSDVLIGAAALGAKGDGYINAALALPHGQTQPNALYAKQHLVPFGEYAPPGFGWFFQLLRIPMSDFQRGDANLPPMQLGGLLIAPNICYEDLFGEELIATARTANVLVNLSNTAWFGDSLAQPQHLQIARLRALETGRPMLRATNSGVTAHITPKGFVAAALPPFTTGALPVMAQPMSGLTPYLRYGNAPILALALLITALAWRPRS
jgi:apolipoprotein N-acyltransferase